MLIACEVNLYHVNRNLILFLVAVLLVGGAFGCYQMSKLEDPEIKVKLAMVITTYPGASAHEVELEVTDLLEKQIRSMRQRGQYRKLFL